MTTSAVPGGTAANRAPAPAAVVPVSRKRCGSSMVPLPRATVAPSTGAPSGSTARTTTGRPRRMTMRTRAPAGRSSMFAGAKPSASARRVTPAPQSSCSAKVPSAAVRASPRGTGSDFEIPVAGSTIRLQDDAWTEAPGTGFPSSYTTTPPSTVYRSSASR